MALIHYFKRANASGFGHSSTAEQVTAGLNLSGMTYLVTGCNSGLGRETLRVLTKRGAHVLALARDVEKARGAIRDILGPGNQMQATPIACDLGDSTSISKAIAVIRGRGWLIDGILANAGIMALPHLQHRYGFEMQFLTNHVGHFKLINGLLECLAPKGRVVVVSSEAHKDAPSDGIQFDNLDGSQSYHAWKNYGQSKLANILFTKELARRLPRGQTANCVHPGVIKTNLVRHMNLVVKAAMRLAEPLFLKTIEQGAATQVYVLTNPSLEKVTGKYFLDCREEKTSPQGQNREMASKLWEATAQMNLPS